MRLEVLLVLQLVLPIYTQNTVDEECYEDSDCMGYLACHNNICSACRKERTSCTPGATGFLEECCEGTTCHVLAASNITMCLPGTNKCQTDADCAVRLKCMPTYGECGFCKDNGEPCIQPIDDLVCCSSFCKIGPYGYGRCTSLEKPKPKPRPIPESCLFENTMTSSGVEQPKCFNEGEPCTFVRINDDPGCCQGYRCKMINFDGSAVCSNETIEEQTTVEVQTTTFEEDTTTTMPEASIEPKKWFMQFDQPEKCKPDNEKCIRNLGTNGWTNCCSGFCDSSHFPREYGVGVCKTRIFRNPCTTKKDCYHNYDCIAGKCMACYKTGSSCDIDYDCCSNKCIKNDTSRKTGICVPFNYNAYN